MAGDVIDVMLKGVFELFGWIFKKLFQLAWWIISGIFTFIWRLIFPKKEGASSHSGGAGVDRDAVAELYANSRDYLENLDVSDIDDVDELQEITKEVILMFSNSIVTNGVLTVGQKCELLSLLNEKLLSQDTNPGYYNMVFKKIIEYSYKVIEGVVPSPLLMQKYDTFKREDANGTAMNFTNYFSEIFGAAGMLGSPNGQFNIDHKIFGNYNMPQYREE